MMVHQDFKLLDTSALKLTENQIDLWFLPLKGDLVSIQALLNPHEMKRATRYHFEKHQRRFSLARGFLRLILSKYVNHSAKMLDFSYNKHGKPSIDLYPDLQFNISHSADWALIGVACHHPLGVDIERYSARPYEGIAGHVFSSEEMALLKQTPACLKPWRFFRLWSQKEAFIKACGLGLAYPTADFSVIAALKEIKFIYDGLHDKHWVMHSFMPRLAMSAAVCHHPDIEQIRYIHLREPETFLNQI